MRVIDPKYHIEKSQAGEGDEFEIVKTSNGQRIPEDEPLILFRARDRNALAMLLKYRELCVADGCTDYDMRGVDNRIVAFGEFKKEHPLRMKQSGCTPGR